MNPLSFMSLIKNWVLHRVKILLVFSLTSFFYSAPLSAVTFTWTGASSTDWSDSANWDCGGCDNYPGEIGNTDNVIISTGTGTINLDVSVTINDLTWPHKTLSGSETLTVNGTMIWTRGVIGVTLNLESSSTLNISSTLGKSVNGTLNLSGTTNHSEGKVTVGSNATINNSGDYFMTGNNCEIEIGSSSFFNNTGDMDLSMDGTPFSGFTGTLDNDGTITRSGGSGILTIASDFINDGTLDHQTGSRLTLSGIPVEQNSTLTLHGGEELWTGAITVNSPFTLMTGQTWRMQRSTTINVPFLTSGNLLFAPSGSGTLGGSGSLLMSGDLTLQINSNTITLDIPVEVGGDCDILGTGQKTINNTLTLNGTTDFDEGEILIQNFSGSSSGSIHNSGTFNYNSSSAITFNTSPATTVLINNTGTFNVTVDGTIGNTGSGTLENGNVFHRNGGTGTLNMNNCRVTNNGTFEQSTTGTILTGPFTNDGTIQGIGTIDFFSLSQNDKIVPGLSPGILTLDQLDNSVGTLDFEIQDNGDGDPSTTGTPGTDYDQIAVTGAATLGGALNLDFLGGYEPSLGNQWVIMTCNPCSGTFTTINHSFQNPNAFQVNIVGNDVVLTMVQALPVELVDFYAQKSEAHVLLKWETASETDNRGFEIQSENGQWETIGFVEGKGNSTERNHYSFLDENPKPGVNYYRLRQIDFDGQKSFSKTVAVEISGDENARPLVFPNPVKGEHISFILPKRNAAWQVSLLNVEGKILRHQIVEAAADVSMKWEKGVLPAGVYFLHFENEGEAWTERLILK